MDSPEVQRRFQTERMHKTGPKASQVRSPESAGPKKGPGDLSVGPSVINRRRTIHINLAPLRGP